MLYYGQTSDAIMVMMIMLVVVVVVVVFDYLWPQHAFNRLLTLNYNISLQLFHHSHLISFHLCAVFCCPALHYTLHIELYNSIIAFSSNCESLESQTQ